jgi:hypothetical protein
MLRKLYYCKSISGLSAAVFTGRKGTNTLANSFFLSIVENISTGRGA